MKTWLLTWNVDRWPWDDEINGYKEVINEIEQVGYSFSKWTCGINKSIQNGDRIFLIKLGSEPKGIVASGHAASDVFEGVHWDEEKRRTGKLARRIYVKFDKLIDYQVNNIFGFDLLKGISDTYKWSSQSSGIEIPASIAEKLERAWASI